jgi:hypothetical protein
VPSRAAPLAGHDTEIDVVVRIQAPDAPAELIEQALFKRWRAQGRARPLDRAFM